MYRLLTNSVKFTFDLITFDPILCRRDVRVLDLVYIDPMITLRISLEVYFVQNEYPKISLIVFAPGIVLRLRNTVNRLWKFSQFYLEICLLFLPWWVIVPIMVL